MLCVARRLQHLQVRVPGIVRPAFKMQQALPHMADLPLHKRITNHLDYQPDGTLALKKEKDGRTRFAPVPELVDDLIEEIEKLQVFASERKCPPLRFC